MDYNYKMDKYTYTLDDKYFFTNKYIYNKYN